MFYVQQQEDFEYEMGARYDYLSEAYGAEARDLAEQADDWWQAEQEELAERDAAEGRFEAHVEEWRFHLARIEIAECQAALADIPF